MILTHRENWLIASKVDNQHSLDMAWDCETKNT